MFSIFYICTIDGGPPCTQPNYNQALPTILSAYRMLHTAMEHVIFSHEAIFHISRSANRHNTVEFWGHTPWKRWTFLLQHQDPLYPIGFQECGKSLIIVWMSAKSYANIKKYQTQKNFYNLPFHNIRVWSWM